MGIYILTTPYTIYHFTITNNIYIRYKRTSINACVCSRLCHPFYLPILSSVFSSCTLAMAELCVFFPASLQWSTAYSSTIEENGYYLYVSSAILLIKIYKFCSPRYSVLYPGFKCLEVASRFIQNLCRPAMYTTVSMPSDKSKLFSSTCQTLLS